MNRRQGRYGSFFLNPNYMGAFTVLLFPTLFLTTLVERERWAKTLGWVGLLALIFCLVETQSRGPMLAFGISLVLLLVGPAGTVSRGKRLKLFVAFALLFTLVMPGFIEHAIERFVSIDQEMTTDSARTRETIWAYTKRAIADNPLTGIGFGETQFLHVINGKYQFEQDYGETSLDNPHNSYLQMTVYAGIPVLAVFVLMNLLLLQKGLAAIRRHTPGQPGYEIYGLCVGIAGFLAVIYPDMHMFAQTVAPLYWMVFGLLLAASTIVREEEATATAKAVPVRSQPAAPVFARRSTSPSGGL
jgi:O-antigen ligase